VRLPERLKDHLTTILVAGIAGIFLFFATKIYHDVSGPFLVYVLPAFSNKTLLSLCSILGLSVVLLVWWVIYLHLARREPTSAEKEKQFEDRFDKFDTRLGVWTHKNQSYFFCTKCKASHVESPLRERPDGWMCLVCGKVYQNPDYHKPSPPPPTKSRWMDI
jgi:hypothetical protein